MRLRLALVLSSLLAATGLAALTASGPLPQASAAATYRISGAQVTYLANPAACDGVFGINLAATFTSPKHAADGVAWTFSIDISRGSKLLATVSALGTPYQGKVNPTVACSGLFRAMSKGFLATKGTYRFVIKRAVATVDGTQQVVRANTGQNVVLRRSTIAYGVTAAKKKGRTFAVTGSLYAWSKTDAGFGWAPLRGSIRTLDDCTYRRIAANKKGAFTFTQTVPAKTARLYLDLPPGSTVQPAWSQQYRVKDDGTLKTVAGRPVCA